MGIWKRIWGTAGIGGQVIGGGSATYDPETPEAQKAMKIAAVFACVQLRSEVISTLPIQLVDKDKKSLDKHDLYWLLRHSPNAFMDPAAYWSSVVSGVDLLGNHITVLDRTGDRVTALLPVSADTVVNWEWNRAKTQRTWTIGGNTYPERDVLHQRGFGTDPDMGTSRLSVGAKVLGLQIDADTSAGVAYRQGLKIGGFLLNKGNRDLDVDNKKDLQDSLAMFGRPENSGKYMTLPRGIEPVEGSKFRVSPADAQLLESRGFGIEEICRIFNVPPVLIHHMSKASSWASSIENINTHFTTYSVRPTAVRLEQQLMRKLLTREEINKGYQIRFDMRALMRGDTKTRIQSYQAGLQNGYYSRNEVRDMEEMAPIPGGDEYTIQLNMTNIGDVKNGDKKDD